MPRLPEMREGVELTAYGRSVPFSYWPTKPTVPRPTVQSLLFAIDPWVIMRRAILDGVADLSSRSEALSYLRQAQDFFGSAQSSGIEAAKPVQLYYSFLNIAKAFIIFSGGRSTLPEVQHGISESVPAGGTEFQNGLIKLWRSTPNRKLSAYDELMSALGNARLTADQQVPVTEIVPQILSGHRLWATAADEVERFVSLQRVQFIQNRQTRQVWLRMYLYADDLSRLGQTQNSVLTSSGLQLGFRKVRCEEAVDGRDLVCIEQLQPRTFGRHGVDHAAELVSDLKYFLWSTVGSSPPYRRYYLYLCPTASRPSLLAQLASIYVLSFYLGSVTRYRPNAFQSLLDGPFGPRIAEFVSGQPAQFVYLMASEFAGRDVTRPSIV